MTLWKTMAAIAVSALLAAPALARDVRIGLASEPTAMDPHFHNLTPNNGALSQVFDYLIANHANQKPVPALAESWRAVDEHTWEFKLREGVKFHDGSDFTVDDVIATFARVPTVPNSPSSFSAYVKGRTIERSTSTDSASRRPNRRPWCRTTSRRCSSRRAWPGLPRRPISIRSRPRSAPGPIGSSNMCRATASCSSASTVSGGLNRPSRRRS